MPFVAAHRYWQWDQRLFTLDPVSLAHVMKHSTIYEKPWQSRALIGSLIGVGMLAAEGQMHKRQRRVATPAFSIQNMRALVPVTFQKAVELKERWIALIADAQHGPDGERWKGGARLDVCHWVSRATFDVIGLAGFDYQFNAIHDESNELFTAYKDMFEIAVSQQGGGLWELAIVYVPILDRFAVSPQLLPTMAYSRRLLLARTAICGRQEVPGSHQAGRRSSNSGKEEEDRGS